MSVSSGSRLDYTYKQANNIDASASASLNSGEGFNPIGGTFTGTYNGDDFSISALTIDRPSTSEVGFFGELDNASVSNLTLSSVDITGYAYTGGLAGNVKGTSQISGVTISGSVDGNSSYTGGFVGNCEESVQISNSSTSAGVSGKTATGGFVGRSLTSSQFTQCSASGSVSSTVDHIGGFAGEIRGATISECWTSGNVSGSARVGGFAGYAINNSTVNINNSYCRGTATGSSTKAGGFIGQNSGADISNSFSTGSASGSGDVGGFVGYHGSGTYSNSFWDEDVSGLSDASGGGTTSGITGKTTTQLKTTTTFTDQSADGLAAAWDFEGNPFDDGNSSSLWDMDAGLNDGYPELPWNIASGYSYATAVYTMIPATSSQSTGSGGGFVRTGSSITAHGLCWNTSSSPTISNSKTTDGSTTGNFTSSMTNLQSHSTYYIRAYVTDGGTSYYGEEYTIYPTHTVTEPTTNAGVYQIASLENLGWISEDESRWSYDYAQTTDIDASATSTWYNAEGFLPLGKLSTKFTGTYDGNGYSITSLTFDRGSTKYQGLFGYTDGATLTDIHIIDVGIDGDDYCGGLVGKASNSTAISGCIVEGLVQGDDHIGGFAGGVNGSTIQNSYSRASVGADTHGGGFAGTVENSSTISNCYSASVNALNVPVGPVLNEEVNGGGFIYNVISSTVTDCFFDHETADFSNTDAGEAYSTAEMKNVKSFSINPDYVTSAWDFTDNPFDDAASSEIWDIDGSGTINDGYPHLSYENVALSVAPSVYTNPLSGISEGLPLSGAFVRDGGASITATGVCWNTTGSPTTSNDHNTGTLSASAFTAEVNNSSRSTSYYLRAYATNSNGT
ncbi:MAG: hypothetical protein U9Q77_09420, partial [Candidatus Marinimicrobia bacterium]|nr:hypothetical protein [Candidatus Neomarinimicrobiota bacterium]